MRRVGYDLLALALFAALLFFLPNILRTAFDKASVSYLSLLINALTLAILALSWDILARTGQLSLAHAAFYGAGAYTTAVLVKLAAWPLWVGIPLGGIVAVLLALLLGSVHAAAARYLLRHRHARLYRGVAGGGAAVAHAHCRGRGGASTSLRSSGPPLWPVRWSGGSWRTYATSPTSGSTRACWCSAFW